MIVKSIYKKVPFDGELLCTMTYEPLDMSVHSTGRDLEALTQGTLQLLKEKLELFEVPLPEELKCLR